MSYISSIVGVSHLTVHDDFDGVYSIVKWLSFVAKVN